jgi:hypothetical protein
MSGEHSILAPSRAYRWVKCAGSVTLEAQFPEDDGEEAQEGTAAHEVAMLFLGLGVLVDAGYVTSNGRVVDEAMREGAIMYAEAVKDRQLKVGNDLFHLAIEERIASPSIHPQCWGTPDTILYQPAISTLDIFEYKYGHGFVEVFENWQLLCYVSGYLDALFAKNPAAELRTTVRFHIVQPRSYHRDGPVRTWTIHATLLRAYFNILHAAAHAAMGVLPATISGPQCTNCSAVHACDAAQRAALAAASYAGTAVPFNLPPAAAGKELQVLVARRGMMDARITGLEAQVIGAIKAGKNVPYWQLGSSTPREQWISVESVFAIGDLLGIELRKPVEPITPVQARKKGIDESVISDYSFRPNGELKLIPADISDARKVFSQQE